MQWLYSEIFPLYIFLALVVFVSLQRLLEIFISKQNEKALKERGGREVASGHFAVMRLLHTFWLCSCVVEAYLRKQPPEIYIIIGCGVIFLAGQILRLVAISTLGGRWTVCIVIVPGEAPVAKGIYKYIRHPNYLGVILEIATLPMMFGCWITAVVFSISNAILLYVRIKSEEQALESAGGYQEAFQERNRFIPV